MKGVPAAGFVERGQDVLLKIQSRFPALNDSTVDPEPADVDAF